MNEIGIRKATVADADELARLRWAFRVEHGTTSTRAFDEFLAEFRTFASEVLVDGSPWRAWVAEHDGRLVGCIWMQMVEKVPHPGRKRWERPIAYVTNVYVEPDRRDQGVGARLLATAMRFARERDAGEAVVWPTEHSQSLYLRAGFAREAGPMAVDLAGD